MRDYRPSQGVAMILALTIAVATGCLVFDSFTRLRKIAMIAKQEEAYEKEVERSNSALPFPRRIFVLPRINISNLTFRGLFESGSTEMV